MSQLLDNSVAFRPEDDTVFRLTQLLILLSETSPDPLSVDRITYYDFFAEHPYLVVANDDPARGQLRMAGFESAALAYYSPGQRFATRQERIRADLALLIAYGLARAEIDGKKLGYLVTELGASLSGQLNAMYASAYRLSAQLVNRKLSKLSDKRLHANVSEWLEPRRAGLASLPSMGAPSGS